MANGMMTRVVRVVKDLKVKTFGLSYKVWFVVMDFGNQFDSNDIILGRRYMHTTGPIHDWLTNIIYLRKDGQVLRVNLNTWIDHYAKWYASLLELDLLNKHGTQLVDHKLP